MRAKRNTNGWLTRTTHPVRSRSGGVDTHSLHAVVNTVTANGLDTASVGGPGFCIHTDAERTGLTHVGSHLGLARCRVGHGGVTGDGHNVFLGVGLAASSHTSSAGGVRVVRIGFKTTVGFHIAVCGFGGATIATSRGFITRGDLLRRKNDLNVENNTRIKETYNKHKILTKSQTYKIS
jgi:hypothetical protein